MPVEPPPSRWHLPSPSNADSDGIVGVGADLEPGTILAAYRSGLFPMPLRDDGTIGWWSPNPRGVIELDDLKVSRSLRRSCKRYKVTHNQAFARVIDTCRRLPRHGHWITKEMRDAYTRLHRLGWAHSVESWEDGNLVGGLYGISIGGFFAGESMFHIRTDASKVALTYLVALMGQGDGHRLLDTQWMTDHLRSLGGIELSRSDYLADLELATSAPAPPAFQ